jgi:hypothetical protein
VESVVVIQINCNNCKALLQIDDAFAGGVCRCRYCGTIQTVPKHLKQPNNGEPAPVASVASSSKSGAGGGKAKTLYRKKTGPRGEPLPGSGSGLDELANIVASSGISSSGLTSGRLTKPGAPQQQFEAQQPRDSDRIAGMDRRTLLIVSIAGGVIVLLLTVIIIMAVSDRSTGSGTSGAAGANTGVGGAQPAVGGAPNFLGQPLDYGSVVFVLDRGQATLNESKLEFMKEAVFRWLNKYGQGRQFQVVFWDRDGDVWSFPRQGLLPADKANREALWNEMQNVTAGGATKADKAVRKAADSNPDAIALLVVKPFLEEDFDQKISKALGTTKAKVFTYSLGEPELEAELNQVAKQTDGAYRLVQLHELKEAAGR